MGEFLLVTQRQHEGPVRGAVAEYRGVAQAQPSGGKEVGEDTAGNECDTFYSYFLAWTCNTHLNPDKMCISMQTL